jgi:hypothetical protein
MFRSHFIAVQADEEVKRKFKDDLTPIAHDCLSLHELKEGNDSVSMGKILTAYERNKHHIFM